MKKTKTSKDLSNPYRSFDVGGIKAPVSQKDQPKAGKIVGQGDLRGGKK